MYTLRISSQILHSPLLTSPETSHPVHCSEVMVMNQNIKIFYKQMDTDGLIIELAKYNQFSNYVLGQLGLFDVIWSIEHTLECRGVDIG